MYALAGRYGSDELATGSPVTKDGLSGKNAIKLLPCTEELQCVACSTIEPTTEHKQSTSKHMHTNTNCYTFMYKFTRYGKSCLDFASVTGLFSLYFSHPIITVLL